ncbi:MAG: PH domain-containing protein [Fimbriimonadaceae bacterium]|nr:PH domain-containing protein [Fimbriimonadaceae bacterium]
MKFTTKVDAWIAVLMIVSLGAGLVVAVSAFVTEGDWLGIPIMVGVIGLMAAIVWPCNYRLEEKELVIRSGLIKWRVAYSDIKKIEPSNDLRSGPAWSLDRLTISRRKGPDINISPKDRDRFLKEIKSRMSSRR